jgi:hypothetical protein
LTFSSQIYASRRWPSVVMLGHWIKAKAADPSKRNSELLFLTDSNIAIC